MINYCPVCNSTTTMELLTLANSPIYQHPIESSIKIPTPYHVELCYLFCSQCGHGFQKNFNSKLLDDIYKNHYYTPAPDGIGTQFRDEFYATINPILANLNKDFKTLEIGSSSGEVLQYIKQTTNSSAILGYEPSIVSANFANKNGIPTICNFFNLNSAKKDKKTYDLIISRHVIEHIIDFKNFWEAINHVSHNETFIILETPSLEVAMEKPGIEPFHIEHAHVFSISSLTKLAGIYGWSPQGETLTSSGNMIIHFSRHSRGKITSPAPEFNQNIQDSIAFKSYSLHKEIENYKTILWGAGAGGLSLICTYNISPDFLTDGNKNKKGKKFCGHSWIISYGPELISELQQNHQQDEFAIIIGTTFFREVRKTLLELNWQGKIISPYEQNTDTLRG